MFDGLSLVIRLWHARAVGMKGERAGYCGKTFDCRYFGRPYALGKRRADRALAILTPWL